MKMIKNEEALREMLKFYNVRMVSEMAKLNYPTLRNFTNGYRPKLTDENYVKVVNAIEKINAVKLK